MTGFLEALSFVVCSIFAASSLLVSIHSIVVVVVVIVVIVVIHLLVVIFSMLVLAVGVARSISTPPLVVAFCVLHVFNVCTVLSSLWFDGGAVAFVVVLSISGSVRCGDLWI